MRHTSGEAMLFTKIDERSFHHVVDNGVIPVLGIAVCPSHSAKEKIIMMAPRIDPEVRIRELLEELHGCNDQGHCSAMARLFKVLKQQKKPLNSALRRQITRMLHTFITINGDSVVTPAEAVRCLGTNVLWDRQEAKWLNEQRPYFNTKTLLPVNEAINEVFAQQRQRRNHVKDLLHELERAFVEE
jgi:hypothetical protein